MIKKILATVITCILAVVVTAQPGLATSGDIAEGTPMATLSGDLVQGDKYEVVYANLDAQGTVREINVVNMFQLAEPGIVVDYGDYSVIKNLTDTQTIVHDTGHVEFSAPAGDFYYQGTMNQTALPWHFTVAYTLDGKPITPDQLSGQSGRLEIHLKSEKNTDIDPAFYDYYMLQISVTLDTTKCRNIDVGDGTAAQAGKDKMITYTVLPGSDGDVRLSADVTSFSMVGIDIAAIPFSMPIDIGDIDEMTGGLVLLSDAVAQLNDGVRQLRDGSAEFRDGMDQLSDGGSQLVQGSLAIKIALETIAELLGGSFNGVDIDFDWTMLAGLPAEMETLAATLDSLLTEIGNLKTALSTVDSAMAAIPNGSLTAQDIAALYTGDPDHDAMIDELYAGYAAGQNARSAYYGVKNDIDTAIAAIDSMAEPLQSAASYLRVIAGLLRTALESGELDDMLAQLADGIGQLSEGYGLFHQGLVAYTNGVSAAAAGYHDLDDGIAGLYDGTSQLNNAVGNIPEQIELQFGDLMDTFDNGDFEPVSFVSPDNETVVAVQFVLKLDGVEAPAAVSEPAPDPTPESLLTRLVNLFAPKKND